MANIAIVVSGGPAPGINSVVSATVIDAANRDIAVFGASNGFESLVGSASLQRLEVEQVSRIHNQGGSIIGTSRFNPLKDDDARARFLDALKAHDITRLIVIGGDGSAYLSYRIHNECPNIAVVHVPKTIDNDLDLPNHYPSFGFETARQAGTEILDTLSLDAKTCRRWFLVTTMGRRAGFLALGLGLASGTTLTLIPEQFEPNSLSPSTLAAVMEPTIRKRCAMGRPYGVILMAEGLLDALIPTSSPRLSAVPRDELGRLSYAHVELGELVQPELERLLAAAGRPGKVITKNIGYELRCRAPVSFDIEYTRLLAAGAVKALVEGRRGVMVVRDFDRLTTIPLSSMALPDGTIRSRRVDLNSDLFRVAQRFMVK